MQRFISSPLRMALAAGWASWAAVALPTAVSTAAPVSEPPEVAPLEPMKPPGLSTNLGPWRPPPPPADDFDWIELKSGEWLKGRLKALQDKELEFDSEELDLQVFDWDDVRQVRSSRSQDLLFDDHTEARGPLLVTPSQVIVGDGEPATYPRTRLLSITPTTRGRLGYWSGKASVGLTVRSGNTSQAEFNASASLQRRTPATRFKLDYLGYLSEIEGVETANSHRASGLFDVWLSRRLFLRVPWAEYFRDRFQNINHRATVSVDLGYDIIDMKRLEWNIVAGPAYQRVWLDSVQPGSEPSKTAAAVVFGSYADIEVTKRTDLILEYRGIYTSRQAGETSHHGEIRLELELTRILDLDIAVVWDRISQPKPSADGTVPQPDDYRLIVGFGLDF